GSALLSDRAEAVERPEATQPLAVSASQIKLLDGYELERRFTGQIEPPQTADLSFEQGGTLNEVLVNEGDAVVSGQLLARQDSRLFQAEVDRLRASKDALAAQLELATLTDERQAQLKERGFASAQVADQTRLSISELNARMAEVDAGLVAAKIRLEKTEIRAPFDGAVNTRLVDPGNTIGGGQAVLSLVENKRPVFRVGIAPNLADHLKAGDPVTVEIGGNIQPASIIGILPQVDAATRTRIVRAQLQGEAPLAFGQTGDVVLRQSVSETGSWVPLTTLEDGVRGLWTIKTVTGEDTTRIGIEAVEILYANSKDAFVRGTFQDGTRYLTQGVHRVVAGQQVRVAN
ncbi:MAG: efflux RND transporter periplasmic adaptor subunit, partial [Pseudomonadota bacterium]